MNFKEKSIKDFIDELASNSAVPGGGGAAALTASLSAALSSMVFNLTIDKKSFSSLDQKDKDKVLEAFELVNKYAEGLADYIDKDGEAFSKVMAAYKLPKDTEKNLKIREEQIQSGLNAAMMVPYNLAKDIVEMMKYINIASKFGNKNVISDAGVSAILAYASVESSVLNVMVNLNLLNSNTDEIKEGCSNLLKKAEELKNLIMSETYSKI